MNLPFLTTEVDVHDPFPVQFRAKVNPNKAYKIKWNKILTEQVFVQFNKGRIQRNRTGSLEKSAFGDIPHFAHN